MNLKIACVLGASLLASAALADDKIVRIGSLSDQSSLYADLGGPGSTLAAQMAVEDSGLTEKGWTIERDRRRPSEQARHRRRHRAQMV